MIHVKSSKYYKSDSVFKVGVYGAEVTPVPIPNTEVKLCREDDTWLATARETISMPALSSLSIWVDFFIYSIFIYNIRLLL